MSEAAILNVHGMAELLTRTVEELADVVTLQELIAWEDKRAEELRKRGKL